MKTGFCFLLSAFCFDVRFGLPSVFGFRPSDFFRHLAFDIRHFPPVIPMSLAYPIVWTDVLQPYSTSAAADTAIAVFGAMSFWWMGEHGTPRIDTSEHVYFVNDQLAFRFIEEIDFDYAATDATAALITAAS